MSAKNVFIIGVGHKARNGKDSFAKELSKMVENTVILHWADALYEEVSHQLDTPLMYIQNGFLFMYNGLINNRHSYLIYSEDQFPEAFKFLKKRNITKYEYMKEKDPELLQLWGTDYRRNKINPNYWVYKTLETINKIISDYYLSYESKPLLIVLPDTRFKNEYSAIKGYVHPHYNVNIYPYYVDVIRYNDDGSRFIASDRDPNHPSEVDLDDIEPDYVIRCGRFVDNPKNYNYFLAQIKYFIEHIFTFIDYQITQIQEMTT